MRKISPLILLLFAANAVFAIVDRKAWVKVEHIQFSFSLPVTFKQTNVQGIDSLSEEYIDWDSGLIIHFDTLTKLSGPETDAPGTTRRIVELGPATVSLVTWPPASDKVRSFMTAVGGAPEGPNRFFTMYAHCRDESALTLAHEIFATLRFHDDQVRISIMGLRETDRAKASIGRECQRALLFPSVDSYTKFNPREYPQAQAVVLALKTLQIMENKVSVRAGTS